jgi:hypothetical protein
MDPNKDTSLQRIFIEALKQIEPIDALVFRTMAEKATDEVLNCKNLVKYVGCRETLAAVSVDGLTDLGVLRETGAVGNRRYKTAPLGMELYLACNPDAPD